MTAGERKKSSLTSQSAWILVAKVLGFALNTALPLLIVRYLSQENVGVYRQAFLIASNAVIVLPLGFSMSAYYFLNREPEKQPAAVLNILLFNFAMGAIAFAVFAFFPGLLGSAFQSPELARLSPIIGILIWLWIFAGFLETAALALQEAKLAAGFILLSQVVKTAMMIAAVLSLRTVDSLLWATIILFAVQAVVLLAYLNRRYPAFWKNIDPPFFGRQFSYALPFGLSFLLYVGQTDVHNYFVSHSFSAAEFAIYSVGCFQLPLIALLYESVGSVMIPRMSQLQDEGRKREMLLMTVTATQKLALAYFPLFCFLMIVSNEFITTLFTKDYSASAAIFRVNLFALPLFSLVVDPITRAFPDAGRFLLKVRVFICVVLFTVFWMGIGSFGMIEMIAVVVAAILFEKLAAAWISARKLDVKAKDIELLGPIGRIAMASVASGAVLYALYFAFAERLMAACKSVSGIVTKFAEVPSLVEFIAGSLFLGVCFVVFGAAYLLFADRFGAIGQDDKDKLTALIRKVIPRKTAPDSAV